MSTLNTVGQNSCKTLSIVLYLEKLIKHKSHIVSEYKSFRYDEVVLDNMSLLL